jgi:ribosome biogenesis GTPase
VCEDVCGILGFVIAEVIATYGRHLLLQDVTGARYKARPLGRKLEIVCGDQVECSFQGEELLVSGTLPRASLLRRATLRSHSEALAANLTRMAVVVAPLPVPDLFLVDRYLCAAECAGIDGLVVLNKNDLPGAAEARTALQAYEALGYAVVAASTHQTSTRDDLPPAPGIEPLREALHEGTTILVGQSGVGKSSLTQRLAPGAEGVAVGDLVRDVEGRHTTTASCLYECEGGGRIMDSPGVRDFAPAIDDLDGATLGFREVARLAGRCRFLDCRHMQEPGCAVRDAVEAGTMDARRYESYRRLRRLYEQLWEQRPERERAARRHRT